jgi:preprotein translocase subunit SecF
MRTIITIFATFALLWLTTAHAYIGPGIGAGTIAVVLGVLSSIFFAFVGILWYPVKRLLKRKRPPMKHSAPPSHQEKRFPRSGSQ